MISEETSYAAELQLVDLSEFASVQALAARFQGQPIDILIANAGMASRDYILTPDGLEQKCVCVSPFVEVVHSDM